MILPALFHWSPSDRFQEIHQKGLQPFQQPTTSTNFRASYICLGTEPASAWHLSGATAWGEEVGEWDLWQVAVQDHHEVRIRTEQGPKIIEVRVHGSIAADCLFYCGRRDRFLRSDH